MRGNLVGLSSGMPKSRIGRAWTGAILTRTIFLLAKLLSLAKFPP